MEKPFVYKHGFENARFLHVSTDEVYGSLGDTGLFTEETPYAPNSPYSASKASSDFLVRSYHHTYGMNVVTTNCSNNYGSHQFPEKLIPLMINNIVNNNIRIRQMKIVKGNLLSFKFLFKNTNNEIIQFDCSIKNEDYSITYPIIIASIKSIKLL